MFDTGGPPVNAYANRFHRRMGSYIIGTDATEYRLRSFELDPRCYPDPVTDVTVRISHVDRTHHGGAESTSVTYTENWSGDRWECRWGRHENDHNARDHFHHPPTPDDNTDPYAYDADYGQGVLLLDTPIEFIMERMNDLATTNELLYPSEYEWNLDYQPETYHVP